MKILVLTRIDGDVCPFVKLICLFLYLHAFFLLPLSGSFLFCLHGSLSDYLSDSLAVYLSFSPSICHSVSNSRVFWTGWHTEYFTTTCLSISPDLWVINLPLQFFGCQVGNPPAVFLLAGKVDARFSKYRARITKLVSVILNHWIFLLIDYVLLTHFPFTTFFWVTAVFLFGLLV